MRVDKRKLKHLKTDMRPGGGSIKVSYYRMEKLGLYKRPPYEPNPIRVDKRKLKRINIEPLTGNTIKVDFNRLEELGLYTRLPDVSESVNRFRYMKYAAAAAGLAISFIGFYGLYGIRTTERVDSNDVFPSTSPVVTIVADTEIDTWKSNLYNTVEALSEEPVAEEVIPEAPEEEVVEEEPDSDLVMANVNTVLNVRAEASEDSERVGLLYKDCGGTILEQQDGWTKIQSGDLVGWASDEYLLFDDEAQALADEVGNMKALIQTSSLRVRTAPDFESDVLGSVAEGDSLIILDEKDGWAEVEYRGGTGYIFMEYADAAFLVETGETIEAIKEREAALAAARATVYTTTETVTTMREPINADASDLEMMAAIIYCEAGNQSYEGMLAVGSVVINRLNSPSFPNTIAEVLRAPKQFSPVGSGKFDRVLNAGSWSDNAYLAAQEVLGGVNNIGDCLYFKNPKIAGAHSGIVIGDHVFW